MEPIEYVEHGTVYDCILSKKVYQSRNCLCLQKKKNLINMGNSGVHLYR